MYYYHWARMEGPLGDKLLAVIYVTTSSTTLNETSCVPNDRRLRTLWTALPSLLIHVFSSSDPSITPVSWYWIIVMFLEAAEEAGPLARQHACARTHTHTHTHTHTMFMFQLATDSCWLCKANAVGVERGVESPLRDERRTGLTGSGAR